MNKIGIAVVLLVSIAVIFLVVKFSSTPSPKPSSSVVKVKSPTVLKKADIEQQRKQIMQYHRQRKIQSLIQAAKEYLKSVPRDEEIWILLSENYLSAGELNEAENVIRTALRVNPNSPWGLRILSSILRTKAGQSPQVKQELLSKAELHITRALRIDPNDAWVNLEAAQLYLTQGKEDKALHAVNKAIKLDPEQTTFSDFKEHIKSVSE